MLTPEVRDFLLSLLDQITLSSGDPNFEQTSTLIVRSKKELAKETE